MSATRKKKPNKQKEVTAETFARMAADARAEAAELRQLAKDAGGTHELYAIAPSLEAFARINDREAQRLRDMR